MTDALSAAAEPTRRRLLQLLATGPRTVTELALHFTVTRSAISQHLAVLADAGLVTPRKDGRQRIYSVVPAGISQLRVEIDRFWSTELDLWWTTPVPLENSISCADQPACALGVTPGIIERCRFG